MPHGHVSVLDIQFSKITQEVRGNNFRQDGVGLAVVFDSRATSLKTLIIGSSQVQQSFCIAAECSPRKETALQALVWERRLKVLKL